MINGTGAEESQGESALDAAIAALPSLYDLQLGGQWIGVDGASKLAGAVSALRSHSRLTSLSLANNHLTDDGAGCILQALLERPSNTVRFVDLGWNSISCQGGGASTFATALRGRDNVIVTLDLECNDFQDAGTEVLAAALPSCPRLRTLRLGGNRIGVRGGTALAAALPRATVETLELGRNFLGPQGAAALAGAACRSQLRSLVLSVNRLRDAGAAAFAAVLTNTGSEGTPCKLDCLDLANNLIGDGGATALAHALRDGQAPLRSLLLGRNRLSQQGAEALAEAAEAGLNFSLQAVDLAGNPELGDVHIGRLLAALRKNCRALVLYDPVRTAVEMCQAGAYKVDLTGVFVGVEGARLLCQALGSKRARVQELVLGSACLEDDGAALMARAVARGGGMLATLDLRWNRISQDGAVPLSELLRSSVAALQVLELECNDLRDAGASTLAEAIAQGSDGRSLTTLGLASNGIGPLGAERLAAALAESGCSVVRLELGRNRIGARGAKAFGMMLAHASVLRLESLGLAVNRLQDAGADVLATGLEACTAGGGLELNVRGNLIGDAGASALARALSRNPGCLSALNLDNNKLTGAAVKELADAVWAGPNGQEEEEEEEHRRPLTKISASGNLAGASAEDAFRAAAAAAAAEGTKRGRKRGA